MHSKPFKDCLCTGNRQEYMTDEYLVSKTYIQLTLSILGYFYRVFPLLTSQMNSRLPIMAVLLT